METRSSGVNFDNYSYRFSLYKIDWIRSFVWIRRILPEEEEGTDKDNSRVYLSLE